VEPEPLIYVKTIVPNIVIVLSLYWIAKCRCWESVS